MNREGWPYWVRYGTFADSDRYIVGPFPTFAEAWEAHRAIFAAKWCAKWPYQYFTEPVAARRPAVAGLDYGV